METNGIKTKAALMAATVLLALASACGGGKEGEADGAGEDSTYDAMIEDPRLESLEAISSGRIVEIPYRPFNITDRPPSVPRIYGILWVAETIYPDVYDFDLREELKGFYDLFYGIELTDGQADEILGAEG